MVVFSVNKKRAVKTAAIIVMSACLLVLCAVISAHRGTDVPDFATADEIGRYSTEAPDTKAQVKFLKQFGLNADAESKKSDKITIPATFNEVYSDYNKLQKAVGLSLEPYKGQQAERAVYKLKDEEKYVTLLVFKARIIGGHMSTGVYGDAYEGLNGTTG